MEKNVCIVYKDLTEVYEKLILFCISKRFNVNEKNEKFYLIKVKNNSFLFWKNMRMEIQIVSHGKTQVKVTTKIFTLWKRRHKLEEKYIKEMEKYILTE